LRPFFKWSWLRRFLLTVQEAWGLCPRWRRQPVIDTFHTPSRFVDIGIGDEVLELTTCTGKDWLRFAGVKTSSFPAISAEQQFAEKLHAYTLPRGERMNLETAVACAWSQMTFSPRAVERENSAIESASAR